MDLHLAFPSKYCFPIPYSNVANQSRLTAAVEEQDSQVCWEGRNWGSGIARRLRDSLRRAVGIDKRKRNSGRKCIVTGV